MPNKDNQSDLVGALQNPPVSSSASSKPKESRADMIARLPNGDRIELGEKKPR